MTTSYTAGTVSVTAGSDIVTGVGTGWQSANIAPGYFGLDSSNGNPVPVLEVLSDTQMRLVKPWRGTTASGQAYWLSYDTRDGQQTVNNAQRLAEYIARLNNPVVSALSGITPAEGTFPYFDSATTAIAAPISAFGLSLVEALNSGAAYSALGVVPNAQLPTRLREISTAVADANLAITNGTYGVASSAANIPVVATGSIAVFAFNATNLVQIYTRVSNGDVWIRNMGGGTWGSWVKQATLDSGGFLPSSQLPTRLQDTPPSLASTDDLNNFTSSGFYQWGSPAPVNAPFTFGFMIAVRRSVATAVQIAFNANSASPMVRYLANSVWSGWGGLATLDSLGVVADGLLPARLRALPPASTTPSDANLAVEFGLYRVGSSTPNIPTAAYGLLLVTPYDATNIQQMYLRQATNEIWHRRSLNGTWAAWRRIDGDVSGPSASIDGQFAAANGTSGKSIKFLTTAQARQALGGWETITLLDLSGVSVSAVTNLGDFTMLRCSFSYSLASAGSCYIQFSTNNGGSYFTANTNYRFTLVQNEFAGSSTLSGGDGDIIGVSLGDDFSTGHVTIGSFNKARDKHAVSHQMIETATARYARMINTKAKITTACNAIRLFSAAGNISGQFLLEGIRG